MAQIGYNTITITDTNDIERIYTVYAKSTSNTTAPSASADLWTESISTAPGSGDYIWQRTVVKKSGTGELTYSTPVCVTGPEGDQGKGVKSLVTQYYLSTASDSVTGGSWSAAPQSYPTTGTKYYWTKTITTYTDDSTYESTPVYNVALTNSVKDARDANTTANEAKELSEQTHVDVVSLQTRTKYFWTNLVAHTNGTSGWTKPNYPAGTYAASGISGTTFDYENSSTYGYNTLYSNGIKLRYNAINLGELTGSSLTFYNPSTTSQGTKAMELSGSALKFYASDGATIQAEFGGTKARVSGTIEALDGQIGNNANNYWYIGNYTDYNQNQSAAIKSHGTAFIQLGDNNTWRIATNRFHSAWNDDSSGTSGQLHYPVYDSKYWDSGLHLPTSSTDKFLYIRNAPNTQTLENLQNDLEDSGYDYWTYRFYISADGSLYARNLYVLDDNGNTTQIGGTDGVYLLKSGGTITGNLEVNGTLTKDSKNVAYFTTTPTTGQIVVTDGTAGGVKTTGYTIAKSVPSNALFTDANVAQTATTTNSAYELLFSGTADNTTRTEGARKTSTLTYNPSTKALVTGGTVNGYTLAAASAKGVDTSMTAASTSTNLPTTKAVADLIKTYLSLSGGTVSGETIFNSAVSVNDEFEADSITTGNLIVTGAGRFTNGIYGDLTGNVIGNVTGSLTGNASTATTATKVGNNLIIKLNSGTTEGTDMFTFNGSAAKTVDITKSKVGLGNVENKSSATIRGELTSANVTTALGFTPYDSTNPNGYVTSSGVTSITLKAGGGITLDIDNTAITTTGTRTISHADTSTQTSSSNSGRTYIQSVTLDEYGHVTGLSTATETVTNTDTKLQVAAVTSGTTYYPIVGTGTTAATRQYDTTGFVYVGTNGTTSAVGSAKLTLGNSTASGTANNKQGQIILYGSTAYAHTISGAPTAARTITLPDKTGTVALTSDALKNPNALTVKVYGGSSTSTDTSYDGSTANQSVEVAGKGAITGISASTSGNVSTFTVTKANGDTSTFTVDVVGSTVTGATKLTDGSGNAISVGSTSTPVYFSNGLPVALTSSVKIDYNLLPTGTSASTVAIGNHTHAINLASDTGTSSVTLAHGGKYKLTAGGQSVIFTLPSDNNTDTKVKLTSQATSGTYPLMFGPTSITSGNAYEVYYNTGVTVNPSTKTVTATTFSGNASTATKFNSSRTVALTGDVTGSASGDGSNGWSVATTIQDDSHNHTLATILPLKSKTFTDVIGTANNWAGATFFYGSIKPTTWDDTWRIKYKIHVYVPNHPTYNQLAEVVVSGKQGDFRAYASFNTIGSYYVCYYHELYRLKQAGFTNGYGHSLGVRFYSAYEPINTDYKRTIEVEILETENCSFDFYDNCLKYAEIPGTGATNYNTYTEMDFVSNGMQETGDANDVNYYNREYYGSRTTSAAVYRYQFCLTKSDGQLVPINTVNNSVATDKTLTTDSFDPFGDIFFWASTSTYNAGANVGNANWYRQYLADLRYSFNCGGYDTDPTLTARAPLYLVATPQSDGTAVLYNSPLSMTLPANDDGLIYIYLGRVYEDTKPYRVVLSPKHPVYWYKNGAVRQYTHMAQRAVQDGAGNTITSTYLPLSGGTMTGGVTFVGNQGSAWNDKGILFTNGSRIGENSTGGLGIYAKDKIILRPASGTSAGTDGVEITTTGLMPTNNNSENLGGASNKWSNVYATTFTGALSGNATSATKANLTTTANAVAYYTDTAGTFGTKASANGALYATAANGALSWGTLPVAQGGTGATTFTSGAALIGNGTGAIQTRSITNVTSGAVTASTNLVTANSLVAHVANKISAASDTYVTLTTAQTISGIKTFSNGAKFGTHWDISEDSTTNALVFKYVS